MNPVHKQAWEYLKGMDKDRFRSYSNAIAIAVTAYFDKYYKVQADPYLETREREEQFISQIISAVEAAMTKALPEFLLSFVLNTLNTAPLTNTPPINAAKPAIEDTNDEDVDWSYFSDSE